MVNNFLERWLGPLLPACCLLCGDKLADGRICRPCRDDLPAPAHPCPRCALPLDAPAASCGACLSRPPPWNRCITPLLYRLPASSLLAGFKYQRRLAAGRLLADLLLERLRREGTGPAELLLPVPMHWRRRLRRGFNQTELIADQLGAALGLPVAMRGLQRSRPTSPQQALNAAARARNLRGAFTLTMPVVGRHLALIDDVVTTGATATELCRLLQRSGAASVQLWALARTPP